MLLLHLETVLQIAFLLFIVGRYLPADLFVFYGAHRLVFQLDLFEDTRQPTVELFLRTLIGSFLNRSQVLSISILALNIFDIAQRLVDLTEAVTLLLDEAVHFGTETATFFEEEDVHMIQYFG
jgi:hypothetical protein